MAVETTGAASRGGVRTALDIVVAPNSAFDALRAFPTWGWALLLSMVGAGIGAFLALPATQHFIDAALPSILLKNPQIAKLSPDAQQEQIRRIIGAQHSFANFNYVIAPLAVALACALQAVVMLLARVAGGGEGAFRRFWALACNASIVGNGLGSLVLGLICVLRGPAAFNSALDLQTALPSLALVAPGASPPLAAFLATANVFYVWAAVLLALGMVRVARIRPMVAWIAASVFIILPGLFAAFGARSS